MEVCGKFQALFSIYPVEKAPSRLILDTYQGYFRRSPEGKREEYCCIAEIRTTVIRFWGV
jgi:hypothetical protein